MQHSGRAPQDPAEGSGNGLSAAPQVFRHEGDYWTISYAGTTVRLRDAVGVRYLARLLARPNEFVPVEELLAAVRGTTAADADAEAARSTVTKRIRDALRRVAEHHPLLGYHLRAGIRTGARCVYVSDPAEAWTWVT